MSGSVADWKTQTRTYKNETRKYKERIQVFQNELKKHRLALEGRSVVKNREILDKKKAVLEALHDKFNVVLDKNYHHRIAIDKLDRKISSRTKRLQNKLNLQLSENDRCIQEMISKKEKNEKARDALADELDTLRDSLRGLPPSLGREQRRKANLKLRCPSCRELFVEPEVCGCGGAACHTCGCLKCKKWGVEGHPSLVLASVVREASSTLPSKDLKARQRLLEARKELKEKLRVEREKLRLEQEARWRDETDDSFDDSDTDTESFTTMSFTTSSSRPDDESSYDIEL